MAKFCPNCGLSDFRNVTSHYLRLQGRVLELIQTNDSPRDDEKVNFVTVVSDGRDILSDLDSRITRTRTALEDLIRERERVDAHLQDTRTLLHPIRRLPEDILRQIFTACVDPESIIYTENVGDCLDVLKRSQWVLSHVSRRWRRVALNTARLWSSIELFFDMYRTRNQMKLQYMLGLMLERSRGHDIVVAIYSEEDISSLGGLAIVLAGISRCTELTLFIPYASLHAFSMCRGSLSQLRHLFLKFTDDVPPDVSEVDFFDIAPCLRRLNVYHSVDFGRLLRLPWTQIGKCWIKYSSNDVILDVLHKVSSVETITVITNGLPAEGTSSRIVELPHIREIYIQEEDDNTEDHGALAHLFTNLKLPALQKLSFDFGSAVPHFPEISRAPLSNLVDLSIFCVVSDVDAGQGMIEFLRLAHHVRRLHLRVRSVDGRFFAPFFCEPDQPVLLPCLEELDLRESNLVGQSHILVNMLDSRCHDSDDFVKLTRVWLDAPLDVDPDPSVTRRWKGICEGQLAVSYGGEISRWPGV
ncbi:hypothetical protein EDD85DRAFT_167229 [Armillaria nabsnona]|nr:hypothetical protein EDD85DRAFT_167229 [Armillaria nabsnona]